MLRRAIAGAVLAVAAIGASPGVGVAEAPPKYPKTIIPLEFQCGDLGTFVYEGRNKGLQPRGQLNGKTVKLQEIWVDVSATFQTAIIAAEWAVPSNPNLHEVVCDAYYVIPIPEPEIPGDYLFVNGWVRIYIK